MRALYVEDDHFAKVIQRWFQDVGVDYRHVVSVEQARTEIFQQEKYDLVLIGASLLPWYLNIDGVNFASEVRTEFPKMCIILFTDPANHDHAQHIADEIGAEVISKREFSDNLNVARRTLFEIFVRCAQL